jgi:hypothetical protein
VAKKKAASQYMLPACAEKGQADVFLTTDKRLLRSAGRRGEKSGCGSKAAFTAYGALGKYFPYWFPQGFLPLPASFPY